MSDLLQLSPSERRVFNLLRIIGKLAEPCENYRRNCQCEPCRGRESEVRTLVLKGEDAYFALLHAKSGNGDADLVDYEEPEGETADYAG